MAVADDAFNFRQMPVALHKRSVVLCLGLLPWQERAKLLSCVSLHPRPRKRLRGICYGKAVS